MTSASKAVWALILGLSTVSLAQEAFPKPKIGWTLLRDEETRRVIGAVHRDRKDYRLFVDFIANLGRWDCTGLRVVPKKVDGFESVYLRCADGVHDLRASGYASTRSDLPVDFESGNLSSELERAGFKRDAEEPSLWIKDLRGGFRPRLLVVADAEGLQGLLVEIQAGKRSDPTQVVRGPAKFVRSDAAKFLEPSQWVFDWENRWRIVFRPETGTAGFLGFASNQKHVLDLSLVNPECIVAAREIQDKDDPRVVGAAMVYFDGVYRTLSGDLDRYAFPESLWRDLSRTEVEFAGRTFGMRYDTGTSYAYELRIGANKTKGQWASPSLVIAPDSDDTIVGAYAIQAEWLLAHGENLALYRLGEEKPDADPIDLERAVQTLDLNRPKGVEWLLRRF